MSTQSETVVVLLANDVWRAVNRIGQTGHGRTPLDAIVELLDTEQDYARADAWLAGTGSN